MLVLSPCSWGMGRGRRRARQDAQRGVGQPWWRGMGRARWRLGRGERLSWESVACFWGRLVRLAGIQGAVEARSVLLVTEAAAGVACLQWVPTSSRVNFQRD